MQVLTISLAALGSLLWLRKSKPSTVVPIIYASAAIVATMPSITRSLSPCLHLWSVIVQCLYCAKKRRKTIFILRAAKLTVLGFVNWQMIGTAICGEDWLGIFPRWLCLSSQHHCWWPLWHGVFLVLAKDPLYNTHLNWFGSSQHHMAFVMWCLFSACHRPSWHPS
jgi:hypothetical protein